MKMIGLHDAEGIAIADEGSWLINLAALSDNPHPYQMDTRFNWITRLNWGYGSTGTLPLSSLYGEMAVRAATYVSGSSGCTRWIIGNEPNLAREWPDGVPIYPWHYAAAFDQCREAIHAMPGHGSDEVLIAGTGPWNAELKYDGNKHGDWVKYFVDVVELLGGEFDGFALHSYTHGYDVNLVTSTERMNEPFQNRYYNFLCYRDYLDAISLEYPHKPCYITEANGDGAWVAAGLMPAMVQECDWWNQQGYLPEIKCVAFFRYPDKDDGYQIEGKGDVINEYKQAAALNIQSGSAIPSPQPPTPPTPQPEPEPEPPQEYTFTWDIRLDARGTKLTVASVAAGSKVWHITYGEWFNEQEAEGRINCYIRVRDEYGNLISGVPVKWFWQGDDEVKPSELKSDPWLGGGYSLDFPMYNVAPSYGFTIADGLPSDVVDGLGLGSIEQPYHKIHTCYLFDIQRMVEPDVDPIPPQPIPSHREYVTPFVGANLRADPVDGVILVAVPYGGEVLVDGTTQGSDGYVWKHSTYVSHVGWIRGDLLAEAKPIPPEPSGDLVHPLPGAVITQNFYENRANYEKYDMPGHDGTDFGGKPLGTPILSLAAGVVVRAAYEDGGYGNFVEVAHDANGFTSVYAHAERLTVAVGEVVRAGQEIAKLGSTGNSTGVHLHLSVRLINKDGSYLEGTPMRKGRVDPRTFCIERGLIL